MIYQPYNTWTLRVDNAVIDHIIEHADPAMNGAALCWMNPVKPSFAADVRSWFNNHGGIFGDNHRVAEFNGYRFEVWVDQPQRGKMQMLTLWVQKLTEGGK
jgi:hypothetical protein